MKSSPFAALGFLVVTLTVLAAIGYAIKQKDLRLDAEAALYSANSALEGAKKAAEVAPREVVKFVEVPVAVAAAVKRGIVTPIAAGKLQAESNVVEIPCPQPAADSTLEGSSTPPPPVESTPLSTKLSFGLTGEIFLGAVRKGSVEYTSSFRATAWGPGWTVDVPFADDAVKFDVVVSKDIHKAIDAYNAPWLKRHTALACPGIGISYNPLDTLRPVNVGLTCSYAFVWF